MTAGRSPDARFSLAGETVKSCPAPKEGGKEWTVRRAAPDGEGLNCRRMRRVERRRAVSASRWKAARWLFRPGIRRSRGGISLGMGIVYGLDRTRRFSPMRASMRA
jgi:hypothetical protein